MTEQEMDNIEKVKIQEDREKLTENTPEVRQEVFDKKSKCISLYFTLSPILHKIKYQI